MSDFTVAKDQNGNYIRPFDYNKHIHTQLICTDPQCAKELIFKKSHKRKYPRHQDGTRKKGKYRVENHFAHKSTGGCSGGESWQHITAKGLAHQNYDKWQFITHICCNWRCETPTYLKFSEYPFAKQEQKYKTRSLDVGFCDENGNVVAGIEIHHTNKVSDQKKVDLSELIWVEVTAKSMIEHFKKKRWRIETENCDKESYCAKCIIQCKGKGECWEGDYEPYGMTRYHKDKQYDCKYNCKLKECLRCERKLPEKVLKSRDYCPSCYYNNAEAESRVKREKDERERDAREKASEERYAREVAAAVAADVAAADVAAEVAAAVAADVAAEEKASEEKAAREKTERKRIRKEQKVQAFRDRYKCMTKAYTLIIASGIVYHFPKEDNVAHIDLDEKMYSEMYKTICNYMSDDWINYNEQEQLPDENNLILLYTSRHFALRILKLFNGDTKLTTQLAKEMNSIREC